MVGTVAPSVWRAETPTTGPASADDDDPDDHGGQRDRQPHAHQAERADEHEQQHHAQVVSVNVYQLSSRVRPAPLIASSLTVITDLPRPRPAMATRTYSGSAPLLPEDDHHEGTPTATIMADTAAAATTESRRARR